MVRIDVMGTFAAATPEGPLAFETRSAAGVLAYAALARGRPVSRNDLAAALWPERDPTVARANLRKAVQRVRQALPDPEAFLTPGSDLILDPTKVETDLDRADRLHRTFVLASRQPDGIAALAEEWNIRRRPLLEGWDDDWIVPFRQRATVRANDLGADLACAYEAVGDMDAALGVWRAILERVPAHAQALGSALRLESALRGPQQAADLARTAQLHFRDELGVEMPQELRRTIRDYGMGSLEPVPPPEFLRKRSELYLLARLFESSLNGNRTAALQLLVDECTFATIVAHPRAMLSLLTLALERTEGVTPTRLAVARLAAVAACWSGQFEIGHRWTDYLIAEIPEGELLHGTTLAMKGFMQFEQRDFEGARTTLVAAVRSLQGSGHDAMALKAECNLQGVSWHTGDFGPAIDCYQRTLAAFEGDAANQEVIGISLGNLCYVYLSMERWDEAAEMGRRCVEAIDPRSGNAWIAYGPLGLALFMRGDEAEGLRLIRRALTDTLGEGIPRYNQIALDYAVIALARSGRERAGRCLLEAAVERRAALRHAHSPAERGLILATTKLDPHGPTLAENPLSGQPAATLSEWACEELERLIRRTDGALAPVG